MAATPTPRPKPAELPGNPAAGALASCPLTPPLGVAYSGGADSTALLHAAVARWPGQVHALHVHHGLQAAADDFEAHCRATCLALAVPLHVERVDARHASGESPEEAARNARYAALAHAARAQGLRTVLLAQHGNDQVETLLLALSRGAGLPGLAGMPEQVTRGDVQFVRPLLGLDAQGLRSWLVEQGVPYVDDPTNADTGFTRNRIRHVLLPALAQAFPQYRATFARSMRHAAQAQEVLEALAAEDLARMHGAPVIAMLQALPRGRQANVLRHWLRSVHRASASAAQLDELLDQLADCTTRGHAIRIKVGQGVVERQQDRLAFTR